MKKNSSNKTNDLLRIHILLFTEVPRNLKISTNSVAAKNKIKLDNLLTPACSVVSAILQPIEVDVVRVTFVDILAPAIYKTIETSLIAG